MKRKNTVNRLSQLFTEASKFLEADIPDEAAPEEQMPAAQPVGQVQSGIPQTAPIQPTLYPPMVATSGDPNAPQLDANGNPIAPPPVADPNAPVPGAGVVSGQPVTQEEAQVLEAFRKFKAKKLAEKKKASKKVKESGIPHDQEGEWYGEDEISEVWLSFIPSEGYCAFTNEDSDDFGSFSCDQKKFNQIAKMIGKQPEKQPQGGEMVLLTTPEEQEAILAKFGESTKRVKESHASMEIINQLKKMSLDNGWEKESIIEEISNEFSWNSNIVKKAWNNLIDEGKQENEISGKDIYDEVEYLLSDHDLEFEESSKIKASKKVKESSVNSVRKSFKSALKLLK